MSEANAAESLVAGSESEPIADIGLEITLTCISSATDFVSPKVDDVEPPASQVNKHKRELMSFVCGASNSRRRRTMQTRSKLLVAELVASLNPGGP